MFIKIKGQKDQPHFVNTECKWNKNEKEILTNTFSKKCLIFEIQSARVKKYKSHF